ncbi:hypothetical protein PIB30_078414 [Stylosanthes scabra]|uniref:Uncharacterized protein n=1 Tax=Stylosanthes scabra TaxID=79078 RepID=A0ABU6XP72_9FABA|nr:hypothetical protein [Stylosanthes scabra]
MYLRDANLKLEDFCKEMFVEIHVSIADQLVLKPVWYKLYNDVSFTSVDGFGVIVDGCCILQLLEKSDFSVDPERELKISIDKLVRVHQDLLIMDNQIPFQFLRLLCKDEARLQKCLRSFLRVHGIEKTPEIPSKEKENQDVKVEVEGDDEEDQEDPVIY